MNQEVLYIDKQGNVCIGIVKRVRVEVEREDGTHTLISSSSIME